MIKVKLTAKEKGDMVTTLKRMGPMRLSNLINGI